LSAYTVTSSREEQGIWQNRTGKDEAMENTEIKTQEILDVFERYEIKYLLEEKQYQALRKQLNGLVQVDQYGKTTITNIYFDTPDRRLIRTSLEKPVYKEKLRLRSYGIPGPDTTVFVELKKKYKGVVYKRRVDMPLAEAHRYLYDHCRRRFPSQIEKEINWVQDFYKNLEPSMYIAYDRIATFGVEDPGLRLTFDTNILWREDHLELTEQPWGRPLLKPGQYLLEVKIGDGMPLWLSHIFDELKIYPTSFSKYGNAYLQSLTQGCGVKGETCCA